MKKYISAFLFFFLGINLSVLGMNNLGQKDFSNLVPLIYKERRLELVKKIKAVNKEAKNGIVVFFAAFEDIDVVFRQDSSFFYFSGINQGGCAITIDMDGKSKLFIGNCVEDNKKWKGSDMEATPELAKKLGFDEIVYLGNSCRDHELVPYFDKYVYANLLREMITVALKGGKLFVLDSNNDGKCFHRKVFLDRSRSFLHDIKDEQIVGVSDLVAQMRRKKDAHEVCEIKKSIALTSKAIIKVAKSIKHNVYERTVQAKGQEVFTSGGGMIAYTPVVASGDNGTILHYNKNNRKMKNGELVLVDIGVKLNGYCSDITRTFPVSGRFTERQKELYNLVLKTQSYIAGIAKPGCFLTSYGGKKSLRYLTTKFLDDNGGYGKYFLHGIGHFMGLDVSDVGSYEKPLKEGDIITIEPGIYIEKENIGIRIEDNYLVTKNKVVCLSSMIPKKVEDIEKLMIKIKKKK